MPFTETMTPRERVMNALAGNPVDRPPVANPTNVATVELMDLVDAPFPDACRDPYLAARLAATGRTELGFDAVMPYFTIIQESSALGCEMQWEGKDNWPTVRMYNPIWKGLDDIEIPPGFLEHPRQRHDHQVDQPAQGGVRRRGRGHRQDDGPLDARVPRLRGRALPPDDRRRPRHGEAGSA